LAHKIGATSRLKVTSLVIPDPALVDPIGRRQQTKQHTAAPRRKDRKASLFDRTDATPFGEY